MRSFASLLVTALVLAAPAWPSAQPSSPRAVYTAALEREGLLRKELQGTPKPPTTLLSRIRSLVTAYENMSREYPASGYMDNALWQGALLSADAFATFEQSRDRDTALRMFRYLRERFPTSSLIAKSAPHIRDLERPASPPPSVAAAPPARPGAARPTPASLEAIRRDVLPETLRMTLQLEREVTFRADRLDDPPRVFIDLDHTTAADGIKDAVIPFADDHLVRQARVGRQDDGRTRVVFDLAATAPYSIYTLYSPYRVIIDFDRSSGPAADVASLPAPIDTRPATPPQAAPEAPAVNAAGGFSLSRQLGLGVSRVVIDPGHGGHDPGARAAGLSEAALVLDVALRLEKLLLQEGVEVVLTRRADTFIPLEERTAIANRVEADLFLSIHANASRRSAARGIETYFLNLTTDPEAEGVAARENAASSRTMGQLPDLVRAIATNNKIDESRDFATMVQRSLYSGLRRADAQVKDLGVKQAPFMVLLGASMPSVLAEISFITNREDQALLKSETHRQQIADSLFRGILQYQQTLKTAPVMSAQ